MTTPLSSLHQMPPPFDWIDIPAGSVTLDSGGYVPVEGQTFEVPPYTIAKYPITNAQFAGFTEANGYGEPRWWTEYGWQKREKEKWWRPRFLHNAKFNPPDHPVVGVSWHEAVAFCRWLSDMTGEAIMLPTELQWQRAAQGNTNRPYPWGDTFDLHCCNSCVKTPRTRNSTSPVTRYEGKGDSPFGVVDTCGNAWEWCLTEFHTGLNDPMLDGENPIVTLRGGAWYLPSKDAMKVTFRFGAPSSLVDYAMGFRIAREI